MAETESKYAYKKKSAWDVLSKSQIDEAFAYASDYTAFLNAAKTEREAVSIISKTATKAKKHVIINRGKAAAVVVPGTKPLEDGIRLVVAHVDSPRLDLKQIPLFQDSESNLALFETHYYGGIKKFHWVVIPLALHGVIVKKNGETVTFTLGEDPGDPVFSVPDLLPHLAHEVQEDKKLDDAIKGESLDIAVGSQPVRRDMKEKIKTSILEKLHKDYGIIEEDFISAELEAVPAFKARDVGFDRSLVGGYGQDDRASAYATLRAVCTLNRPAHTAIALFVDKEEIGSEGNTTAQVTTFLRTLIHDIDPQANIDNVLLHSRTISADVNSAVTPNYTEVFELKNASSLGCGVVMSKYTGHGGKYSANDASAEYIADIRALLDKAKVPWQTGELGKVDKGGGGTVAKYISRLGMEAIDMGPAVLSMHSPFELTSKVDVYSAFLAYKAFLNS